MFKQIQKPIGVKIGSRIVNGKRVRVVQMIKAPRIRDFARAAAHTANNFGPWSDEEKPISEMTDEEYYASLGKSSGNTGIAGGGTSGKGSVWDMLGKAIETGGKVLGGGKADASAGKAAGNILLGLGEDYIRDCIRRYKAGEKMSEFDRRVAIAAIEIEGKAKDYGKQKAGEWIMDHLPEIGFGVLGVIVLLTVLVKRS